MYNITAKITLRESILDPKGKASHKALLNLGYQKIAKVRIGKLIEIEVDADSESEAVELATQACQKLLANEVMEDFVVEVSN